MIPELEQMCDNATTVYKRIMVDKPRLVETGVGANIRHIHELATYTRDLETFINNLNSLAFEEWHGQWQDDGVVMEFHIFEADGECVASGKTVCEAIEAFRQGEV